MTTDDIYSEESKPILGGTSFSSDEDADINQSVENPSEETSPELKEELIPGSGGMEYQTTDGEVDPGKPLTTPVERALHNIPGYRQFDQGIGAAAQGVGDFIFDAAGATQLPWLKKADQWWDGNNPKSKDPFHTLVRDVSAVVIPSLVANKVIIGGAAGLTRAKHIPQAQRTLWSILAQAGIETSIAGITSQSYEQDNAAGALNKMFGWNLPWGTDDSMSPDQRRRLHMYEAGGFSAAIDLTLAFGSFAKALKTVNADQKAIALLERDNTRLAKVLNKDVDPVTAAVDGRKGLRVEAQKDEAIKRLTTINDGDYDPFVYKGRKEQKAVTPDTFDTNAALAKSDLYQIQNNINTVDGIMRPSGTSGLLDAIVNSPDVTKRAKALAHFFETELSANVDVVLQGKTIPSKKLNAAVDKLVNNLFDPGTSFEQFKQIINSGKTSVFKGRKVLNEEAWIGASQAWTQAHRELFDPNNLRASAMLTQQAADVVTTTARSLNLLDGIATSSRQWEIMSQKMKFLVGEVTANKDIIRRSVELKELVRQGDFNRVAKWLNIQADTFDSSVRTSKQKAFDVIDEIERIAKEHPEYMRPLAEAYDATNGDVNTLHKLHKFAEANISLLKKAIFDTNPEMPSFFIRGLQSIRYNSILNGLAPINALAGNSIIATIKPISVLTGAFASADAATFKRSLYVYGGFIENFKRGFKMLGSDWRLANSNPEIAVKRGRHDFKSADLEKFEVMESMANAWRLEGNKEGKVAMWNAAKLLTHYTNAKINRWGINSLYAIDGFFKSLMASGSSRAKAYDTLFEATNGAFHKNQFQDLQRHLYDNAFDANGLLTDSAAEFASRELALNLDYNYVDKFEKFLNHVPAAKALFMFPRTGVNGFELAWSFNPVSNLGPAITRARRTLAANTPGEIAEILAEHGLENSQEIFNSLKSEYIGRQLMGGAVIFGTGIWALEGNLTGNGPQDPAERARMIRMGWKPKSFKNPITGEWVSYQGFEPFESVMAMTADMLYYATRVDQSVAEDWLGKLTAAITMNTTNQTFTAGFEPLVSLFSGDEAAWNRYSAQTVDSFLPQRGIRTLLNKMISPQLRDVKNEFGYYLKNYNKFMFPPSQDLPNMVDVYTGQPIKFYEGITAAANAFSPTFKQNGGMEPWRQWLLSTGWDGLGKQQTNIITGGPLTPHARQWINNWIGNNGNLSGHIIKLMNEKPDKWEAELKAYKKGLGLTGKQKDSHIKHTLLHRRINDIHLQVFALAHGHYEVFLQKTGNSHIIERSLRNQIKDSLRKGDNEKAFEARDQLLEFTK